MAVSEEEMIVSTTDYFVSENRLNPKASPTEVAAFVRSYKTNGLVTYTVNSGGVQGIVVVERTRLSDTDSNEVRRVLGMDYEVEVPEGEILEE